MSNQITTAIPETLQRFAAAKEQIALLASQCSNFIVNSSDSLTSAKTLAKDAKKIETLIEDKRKELTKPLLDEQRSIKSFADNLTTELNSAVKELRERILKYEQEMERIRLEELKRLEDERRKQEEELQKQQEELNKKAQETGEVNNEELKTLQAEAEKLRSIESQQRETAAVSSPSSIRKNWTYEIQEEILIPRMYLIPDDKAIKRAIANGVREIAGIKIYQEDSLHLR